MNRLKRHSGTKGAVGDYATSEEFRRIFSEDADSLYQLSFLMTGNHERAEQCFVAGLGDTVRTNRVFKEWARAWAKRTVIQQAIRVVKPRPSERSNRIPIETSVARADLPNDLDRKVILERLLALHDFDRCVFVISVLERYSVRDCEMLLGSSMREVQEAQAHALLQLAQSQSDSHETEKSERAVLTGGERDE